MLGSHPAIPEPYVFGVLARLPSQSGRRGTLSGRVNETRQNQEGGGNSQRIPISWIIFLSLNASKAIRIYSIYQPSANDTSHSNLPQISCKWGNLSSNDAISPLKYTYSARAKRAR